jgi:dethiobiotin synthetase
MIPGAKQRSGKIIFITGTDTGVGKTLFTGLLLHHLRKSGCHALAIKPFCSADRADAKFLRAVQDKELELDEINPFYFSEPVAPLVAARQRRRTIRLPEVLRRIKGIAARCEWLLVEGSGGLFVPLGRGYSVGELIRRLDCEVIVIARNRLGTLNHTLLTVSALKHLGRRRIQVVLMTRRQTDLSSATNKQILGELLAPNRVYAIEFLGKNASKSGSLEEKCKKVKKTLARICGSYNVSTFFAAGGGKQTVDSRRSTVKL